MTAVLFVVTVAAITAALSVATLPHAPLTPE